MPYINGGDRLGLMDGDVPTNCGQLNFIFSYYSDEYIKEKGECYQTYNDIIGALEGAKLELYRRMASPYEDTKIEENGDVYSERNAVVQSQAEAGATAA